VRAAPPEVGEGQDRRGDVHIVDEWLAEPSTIEAGTDGTLSRRDRLGGLIHEYFREAA
jgi:hypothetical protein